MKLQGLNHGKQEKVKKELVKHLAQLEKKRQTPLPGKC